MIQVLQIGPFHWSRILKIPEELRWTFLAAPNKDESLAARLPQSCQVCILECSLSEAQLRELEAVVRPYTCFTTARLRTPNAETRDFLWRKAAKCLPDSELQQFVSRIPDRYFPRQYGGRLKTDRFAVEKGYDYRVEGRIGAVIRANFGGEYTPLGSWRYNVTLEPGESLELWLEYEKDPGVSLQMKVREVAVGSAQAFGCLRSYARELESSEPIRVKPQLGCSSNLHISLQAKGIGEVKIGNLHYRYARDGAGVLLPGGGRKVDGNRQEFLYYFDPMDLKPPLNVYFSGYRPAEGFEGLGMMRRLGAPYLLIYDPRLEGGAFYLGSEEYETILEETIRRALLVLGFDHRQLILSGLSMGAFGALYYGCRMQPHTILLGKPIVNLGTVAENERLLRPGGFPTSLDLLLKNEGSLEPEKAAALDRMMWSRIQRADLSQTSIAAAFMDGDDYDPEAYRQLRDSLAQQRVKLCGKGLIGRHDDNTGEIVDWFLRRYREILREDFGRGNREEA